MRSLFKNDILAYLADKSGYPKCMCENFLNAYHSLLIDTVKNRDRLQDYGYLDLKVKFVPGHDKEDPRDHSKYIYVEDKYKLSVSAGDALKQAARALTKKKGGNR